MKKIILTLIIFTAFISISNAQKRLEFNQIISEDSVLTYTRSNAGYSYDYSHSLIVPQGKTWKIQFLSRNDIYNIWYINGTEIFTHYYEEYNASYPRNLVSNFTGQSIWLKEGDEIKCRWRKYHSGNGTVNYEHYFYLSAIEFNVVEQ